MDTTALLNLAHSILPADAFQKLLAAIGALSLITQALPKFVAWGVPAAGRSADWLAKTALNSPLRPLILWKADAIIAFLDSLASALTLILNTFKTEFEVDLKAAAKTEPTPATPVDTPKA